MADHLNHTAVQSLLKLGILAEYVTGFTNIPMTFTIDTMLLPNQTNRTASLLGPATGSKDPLASLSLLQSYLKTVSHGNTVTVHQGFAIGFGLLAILVVSLRFYSRVYITKRIYVEEWITLANMCFSFITTIIPIIGRQGWANARHTWDISFNDFRIVNRLHYQCETAYLVLMMGVRFSLLIFYLRFSPSKTFRNCVYTAMAFIMASFIAELVPLIFQCKPVDFWNHLLDAKCIDIYMAFLVNGAFQVVGDFITYLMPIPLVWRLQMQTREKILVCAVFAVGIFLCIISIMRNSVTRTWVEDVDVYPMYSMYVWAYVEMNTAIIVSCAPACRPLIIKYFPRLLKRTSNNNSPSKVPSAIARVRQWAVAREQRRRAAPNSQTFGFSTIATGTSTNDHGTMASVNDAARTLQPVSEAESKEGLKATTVHSRSDGEDDIERGRA